MDMCNFQPLAVRIVPRTLDMIAALNDGVTPELEAEPTYFMLYCADSDHEEAAIIDEPAFERTYGKMPGHVLAQYVHTID